MKIIDSIQQNSYEWLSLRAGKLTSSRFGDLMRKGRGGKPSETALSYIAQLTMEVITGEPYTIPPTKDILWGTETEPQAIAFYELATENEVRKIAFIQHDNDLIGSSPDGLIGSTGGLEVKCPKTYTQIKRFLNQTGLPPEYEWQVYGQMYVGELEWVDFVSFDPRIETTACYVRTRVYRDETKIKLLSESLNTHSEILSESIVRASKPVEW